MNTIQYNFQIRPIKERKHWEDITPISKHYKDWTNALLLAQRLSRRFKVEIRLTQGNRPHSTSATYIREID